MCSTCITDSNNSDNSNNSEYTVKGMTCGHCVTSVTEEVSKIEGIDKVEVDLATGALTFTSDNPVNPETIRAAVEEAGYQLTNS